MRITFKRLVIFGCLAVALFMAYMVYQLLTPTGPITISPQTTVITEPLADDGLPDYATHLLAKMKEGVTPENNGAIPFLQAMWPAEIDPADQGAICSELGMEIPATAGITQPHNDHELIDQLMAWYLDQPAAADLDSSNADIELELRGWIQNTLLDRLCNTPWATADAPPLADWETRNAKHFALLEQAAEREKYYLPPSSLLTHPKVSLIHMLLPHVQTLRAATRCLKVRACHHLGSGDLPAAWRDVRAIYRLSETCRNQALVGDMVSIACENIGNSVAVEILNSDELTPELAKQIHQYFANQPERDDIRVTTDEFERLMFVSAVLEMAGLRESDDPTVGGVGTTMGPLFGAMQVLAMDWDVLLTVGNSWYDDLVAAMELPTAAERQAAFDVIDEKLDASTKVTAGKLIGTALSRTSRSKNIGNILSNLLLPAISAAQGVEDRANVLLQLHRTAAAVAVYRLEQGAYPESLDELVPAVIDKRPVDLYGNALRYQRTADGYLLYSLGKNGLDDAGSHDTYSVYKGYEVGETEAEDRALRKQLGEPPPEGDADAPYEMLRPPSDADDWSLRLPLYHPPLPEFRPAGEL